MSSDNRSTAPTATGAFSANDLKRRMAEREAAKAAEELRHMQAQEEQQKAVMAEFHKPAERSAEQVMQQVMHLVSQAADRGQTEVQIYRFPNDLCSDRGRRINNSEPDWPESLEGRAKLAYEFWSEQLKQLGFGLKAEVVDYPGGMPGDIGFSLTWN